MMGDSSVCLARSYSQPSSTSTEENKGNSLQQALTSSVSFGRFMSESLDWERWSAFNHNRYLEEAEKFSRPGSVAEKKAYFEAHFKRRRAAKMLEQQNAAASDNLSDEANTGNNSVKDCSSLDSDLGQKESCVTAKDMNEGELQTSNLVPPVEIISSYNASTETKSVGDGGVQVCMANAVGLENHLENDELANENVSMIKDQGCKKDDSTPTRTLPSSPSSSQKMKPEIPSKLLPNAAASLEKHIMLPLQVKNSDKTPISRSAARKSSNKRRSYETSLHIPINMATCSGETQTNSTKIENPKLIRAPTRKYKNSKIETSTQASGNGLFKHYLATSLPENRRPVVKPPHDRLIPQSSAADRKLQSPFANKARLPSTVPSTFVFRSEERAVKRREKLEQKQKSIAITGEQQQQKKKHVKSEVIARNKCKDSAREVAAPLTELLSNLKKKIPTVRPPLPKLEERASFFKVDDKSHSRPPWKLSVKTQASNDLSGKNRRSTGWPSRTENTSPNIQR